MALEQVTITDPTSGSQATVLVGFGFNCYQFTANFEEPVDVLWSAPNFASGTERPSHSGIPLLFPYPGRLRGTTLNYGGKTYELAGNDGRGNAIHGYVLNRPWKVVEQTPSRVVGEFQASERDASILKQWPADFRLTVSYEVVGTSLRSVVTIENPDDKPLPYGFGSHPYFRLPLGSSGNADECTVMVPAAKYWELINMLPSGKKLPAVGPHGLLNAMRFVDTKLDDIFTDLVFEAGRGRAIITDPTNKRRMELRFDDRFKECVVYNPPHRQAICIEPYTCAPDQFAMAEQGVISEPQTLPPGGKWSAAYEIRLDAVK